MQQELFKYMLLKCLVHNKRPDKVAPGIQEFFSKTRPTHTTKWYYRIMNAVADSQDTVMFMLNELHEEYIVQKKSKHTEGDAKLYEVLQSLKEEYKQDLKWLILMPGDWHALKNFQIALMKPHFDLGLKNIAQVAGYPTQQIKTCKRTHAFILEAWETLYRSMLAAFFAHKYTQKQTSDLQLNFIRFFQAGDGDGKERQSKLIELTEELSHMSKQTFSDH